MANYTLSPEPWLTFLYSDGAPVAAGQLFVFQAGTTTPAVTYINSSGTPNTFPIITLDAAGRCVVYLSPGSYRYDLYDSVANGGALIKSEDNISAVPTSSTQPSVDGIAGEALTAGNVVYLSDGSGAKTAGRWYQAKADNAYSSTIPEIGFVAADISSGATGSVIQIGRIATGITVTAGLTYYVSAATAGAVTSTAPTLARFLGVADSGTSLVISPNPAIPIIDNATNDFRLTLTTGVPVTTADVTAATTIFCTPYRGNRIALYDAAGAATVFVSAQFSIAVPATTSQMYDVFCFNSSGVPTLELLAWTNDTTRATAIVQTTTGVLTKSGDLTRRYLGSARTTTVSGQTEDSATKRYLWNYYNMVPRLLAVLETTDSWAYTTTTYRQANGSAGNQVAVVVGVAEVLVDLELLAMSGGATGDIFAAIGEDSTTTPAPGRLQMYRQGDGNFITVQSKLTKYPAIGLHFYAWLEKGNTTATFYGDGGGVMQSGLMGTLSGG